MENRTALTGVGQQYLLTAFLTLAHPSDRQGMKLSAVFSTVQDLKMRTDKHGTVSFNWFLTSTFSKLNSWFNISGTLSTGSTDFRPESKLNGSKDGKMISFPKNSLQTPLHWHNTTTVDDSLFN